LFAAQAALAALLERFESVTHDTPMRVGTGFSVIDRGRASVVPTRRLGGRR